MINKQLAIIFPGQGSQQVGMMQELARESVVRATYDAASAVLGYDLLDLSINGPEAQLNQTEYTQPVLLTAGVALFRLWQVRSDKQPVLMAGHSLGEYTALVCADSLDFNDAVKLVAERGRLMQTAVPAGSGAMAAIIGLIPEEVDEVCRHAAQGEVVAAANLNAVGQIVISGHVSAVNRAVDLAKQKGAKLAKILPVSVPSHCALMQPAADALAKLLATLNLRVPTCEVIHNADVKSHQDPDTIRAVLATQLCSPVRWIETMTLAGNQGITQVLELGPGKVLTGLNKRIDTRLQTLPVFDEATLQQSLLLLN